MKLDILEASEVLWRFHQVYDPLQPVDIIVGLGSYDLRVAEHCAALFHAGYAPEIVFTGATGNWTKDLYQGTEAAAFAQRAVIAGVSQDVIRCEENATNIGENIRFTEAITGPVRAIFVTKPQTQLRCRATADKQWNGTSLVTAPTTSFADQPSDHMSLRGLICEMVGDLHRLQTYPSLGFQVPVSIPADVRKAADFLVDEGFTDHLPKPAP